MVDIDPRRTLEIQEKWGRWGMDVPLRVLPSEYRSMVQPLMRYLEGLEWELGFDEPLTLVLPEFVPTKLWHFFLHGQNALLLKIALYFQRRSGSRITVVTDVPYYFKPRGAGAAQFEGPRPPLVVPIATLTTLLIGVGVMFVVTLSHGWPVVFEEILGVVAILIVAALFFLLLLRSIFS
jgi:hypothetical protein